MKITTVFMGAVVVIALTTTTQAEARSFNHLDAYQQAVAEQEYSVDSVEQIDTNGKPVFTEYYLRNPDQWGAYEARTRQRLSERIGNNVGDQRRFPAIGNINQGCVNHTINRALIDPAAQRNTQVRYNYYNAPITQSNKAEGLTFYNNYSAYDEFVQRW